LQLKIPIHRRAGPDEASPPGRDEEPDIAERMAEDYVVVDIGLCSQTGMKRHREKTRRENAQWVVFNNTITSVFVEYFRQTTGISFNV
jgi:hypothetical protein